MRLVEALLLSITVCGLSILNTEDERTKDCGCTSSGLFYLLLPFVLSLIFCTMVRVYFALFLISSG